jgi:hypothetical protein
MTNQLARTGIRYGAAILFLAAALAGRPPSTVAAVTAFIDFSDTALGKPLEAKLLSDPRFQWVERTEIERVLEERRTQALFSPEGLAARRALGRLVKAEVLILLRSTDTEPARLELVVCETRQGLRLSIQALPLDPSASKPTAPNSDSANPQTLGSQPAYFPAPVSAADRLVRLEQWVDEALRRYRRSAREIVAVPPLVSNDLMYEHDYLRRAYANLIEQDLLARDDLAVVELAEAGAVTKEIYLTNLNRPLDEPPITRPLPLYLLGEYRHDRLGAEEVPSGGNPGSFRVTIRLKLMRGEQQIAAAAGESLSPADAPAWLRRTVDELLTSVSPNDQPLTRQPKLDPQTEARQLAERARDLVDLGAYEEALPLVEASLLLRPADEPTRRQAIVVCGAIGRRAQHLTEVASVLGVAMPAVHRGLEHLEIWYAADPDVDNLPRGVGQRTFLADLQHFNLIGRRPDDSTAAAVYDLWKPKITAMILRIGRLRAAQGKTDGLLYEQYLYPRFDSRKQFQWFGDRILELQDLPNVGIRIKQMTGSGELFGRLANEGGSELLDRLEREGNAEVRRTAAELRRELEAFQAGGGRPRVARPSSATLSSATPSAATFDISKHEPPLPPGPLGIELKPVELKLAGTAEPFAFSNLLRAGPGVDVLWSGDTLYVMKEPGVVRQVYQGPALNDMFGHRSAAPCLAFDGRYVWATMYRNRLPPQLLVFDPQAETVHDITADLNLPMATAQETRGNPRDNYLAVAGLGPGRACVVGAFGRAWIAKVTFDPAGKSTARIFHEFRRTVDAVDQEAWRDADAEFRPTFLAVLGGSEAASQRLLIGRNSHNSALNYHPLLVDPERETVEVLTDEYPDFAWSNDTDVAAGRLYYLGWTDRRIGLYRFGPPTWKPETLHLGMPQGEVRVVDGRVHVIGRRWWSMDLLEAASPAKLAGPYVTEGAPPWTASNRWVYPDQPSTGDSWKLPAEIFRLVSTSHSSHYGLLISTSRSSPRENMRYQAVVRPAGEK